MRRVHFGLLALLFADIAVQFYLAGVGAFDRPHTDNSFALHQFNGGLVLPILSVLAALAGLAARAPRRLVILSVLPAVLIPVQFAISALGNADSAHTSTADRAILGFHVIIGLVIMLLARAAFNGARARIFSSPVAGPAAAEALDSPAATVSSSPPSAG